MLNSMFQSVPDSLGYDYMRVVSHANVGLELLGDVGPNALLYLIVVFLQGCLRALLHFQSFQVSRCITLSLRIQSFVNRSAMRSKNSTIAAQDSERRIHCMSTITSFVLALVFSVPIHLLLGYLSCLASPNRRR